MYLVHLSLRPPPHGPSLPVNTVRLISAQATDVDGLEHVSVHPAARPHPVVGLFLRAESLAAAEATAERLWRRTSNVNPALSGWNLRRVGVPLLPPGGEWPPGRDWPA